MVSTIFGLSSYAKSTIEYSTNVRNDSLQVIPNTLQQLSEQVAQNSQAIADMKHATGLYGLLIIVLAIMLIIYMLILGVIAYRKSKKNKQSDNKILLRKNIEDFKNDVSRRQRQYEESMNEINRELSTIRSQISILQSNDFEEEKRVASEQQDSPNKQSVQQQVQYLKAEKNDDGFFFEGDSKNSDGCQFKVTFQSKTNGAKGKLQIITNLDNLKSIPSEFLKLVIHKTNNVSLKDAKKFTELHSGLCEYKQEKNFGTWRIIRPINIKLNK